jgi:LysM repeat protein
LGQPSNPAETEDGERRGRYVAVRRGDTLGKIADKADVPLSAITAANPEVQPRKLMPGDLIRIPESGSEIPGDFDCPGDPRC